VVEEPDVRVGFRDNPIKPAVLIQIIGRQKNSRALEDREVLRLAG
jgi:hypothetical protein